MAKIPECLDKDEISRRIEENSDLVPFVLGKLQPKLYGYTDDDFISFGLRGLWYAAVHYDKSRNTEFSTYAVLCIKTEMLRCMDKRRRAYQYAIRISHVLSDEMPHSESNKCDVAFADALPDPVSVEDAAITKFMLKDVMSRMDDNARYLVERIYINGATNLSIAKEQGVSDTTVKNWLISIAQCAKVPGDPITIGRTKRKLRA